MKILSFFYKIYRRIRGPITFTVKLQKDGIVKVVPSRKLSNYYRCHRCLHKFHYLGPEMVVLKDELWQSVNGKTEGVLCLGCIEKTLQRQLSYDDLVPISGNIGFAVNRDYKGQREFILSCLDGSDAIMRDNAAMSGKLLKELKKSKDENKIT